MKKLLYFIVILLICSCGSLKKDGEIFKNNYEIVKTKYPTSKVSKYRHFSYIFMVDCKLVKVLKSGEVINIE